MNMLFCSYMFILYSLLVNVVNDKNFNDNDNDGDDDVTFDNDKWWSSS